MPTIVASVVVAVLAALGLWHVYWALGGRAGRSGAVPQINGRRAFSPSAAGALFFGALVVAVTGGLMEVGPFKMLFRLLAFGLGVTFLARAVGDFRLVGFFKRASTTAFARLDTTVFAPLCLVLGIAVLYVAIHAA